MKLPREVRISIRPDGTVEVVTHGFKGDSCLALAELFEKALAPPPSPEGQAAEIVRALLPEYYQSDASEKQREAAGHDGAS